MTPPAIEQATHAAQDGWEPEDAGEWQREDVRRSPAASRRGALKSEPLLEFIFVPSLNDMNIFRQEAVEDFVSPPSFAVFPDVIFQMYFTQLPICCRVFPIPSTFTLRSGWPDYSCTHAHEKAKGALK